MFMVRFSVCVCAYTSSGCATYIYIPHLKLYHSLMVFFIGYYFVGYLTNTGIKFMILVENIYLNQDGSRRQQDHTPPSSLALFLNNSLHCHYRIVVLGRRI